MRLDEKSLQKESIIFLETSKDNRDSVTQGNIQKFMRELFSESKKTSLQVYVFKKN